MFESLYTGVARTVLNDVFGETVTYRARGGSSGSSITARRRLGGGTGDVRAQVGQPVQWIVSAADVAAPRRGDKLTDASSVVWTISDVEPVQNGQFLLTATSSKD